MNINLFFDKIYLINLKRRPDRLIESTKELVNNGIEFEVFEAIDGNPGIKNISKSLESRPGHVGCILSHVAIIKKAKELNLKSILILEDDIEFYNNFKQKFNTAIENLPEDWDMFYLSGNTSSDKLKNINDVIFRCFGTLTTHAYAIKNTLFNEIIEGQSKLNHPVDVYYNNVIHPNRNCYIVRPYLCKQRASHSDIVNGFRNYDLK